MEYSNDANNIYNYYKKAEDDFLDDVKEMIEGLTPQHSFAETPSPEKKKNYSYQIFDKERETGKFDASEVDRSDINISFDLSTFPSIIREDHLNHYFNDDEKFKRTVSRYDVNEPTANCIIERAYQEAIASYKECMKCPSSTLLKNHKRAVYLRKKLNKKIQDNPEIMEEQEKLTTGKFNSPPKKSNLFDSEDVKQKINEINLELKQIKYTNMKLKEQISLIEKAKASLNREKISIKETVDFEKKRLEEAKIRLEELKSKQSKQTT